MLTLCILPTLRGPQMAGGQKVQLKDLGASHPGMLRLVVNAKRWFTAAAADESGENTQLTVTIGGQCFTHAVRKKTD